MLKRSVKARGRGGKEAREEEKAGSNQQAGADCWFGKRENEKLREEKVRSIVRMFQNLLMKL